MRGAIPEIRAIAQSFVIAVLIGGANSKDDIEERCNTCCDPIEQGVNVGSIGQEEREWKTENDGHQLKPYIRRAALCIRRYPDTTQHC